MSKLKTMLVLFTALVVLSPAYGQNLLLNGDLEAYTDLQNLDGVDGWDIQTWNAPPGWVAKIEANDTNVSPLENSTMAMRLDTVVASSNGANMQLDAVFTSPEQSSSLKWSFDMYIDQGLYKEASMDPGTFTNLYMGLADQGSSAGIDGGNTGPMIILHANDTGYMCLQNSTYDFNAGIALDTWYHIDITTDAAADGASGTWDIVIQQLDELGNVVEPPVDVSGLAYYSKDDDRAYERLIFRNWSHVGTGLRQNFFDNISVTAVSEPVLLAGDANRDGVVSAGDYASVQGHFGETGEPGIPGDANGDGVVSAGDYSSVQANFGNVAGAITSVPEPASLFFMVLGGLGFLKRRS